MNQKDKIVVEVFKGKVLRNMVERRWRASRKSKVDGSIWKAIYNCKSSKNEINGIRGENGCVEDGKEDINRISERRRKERPQIKWLQILEWDLRES